MVMSNSNSAQSHGINFQPMPKRFMVWDKKNKTFLTIPMEMWQIVVHFRNRYHQLYDDNGNSRYAFCQSTNLFDKDGKEIFEGSIISSHSGDLIGVVKQHKSGEWRIWWDNIENGSTTLSEPNVYPLTLISHILSNPELLKKEQ